MANPDKEGTLSARIADVYQAAAREGGHEVRRTNIGDLSFDPILHKGYKTIQELEPDLKRVQEDMRWSDHIVLIYPLWWAGPPALLKGLLDRMFLPHFAFHFHKDGLGWDMMLKGRTARVFILLKSHPFIEYFMFGDFTSEIARAIFGFAGIKTAVTTVGSSEKLSEAHERSLERRVAHMGMHAS